MARTLSLLSALALAIAAALSLGFASAAAPTSASAATAADCGGITLTPSSRVVRRGGSVLLRGRTCRATYSFAGAGPIQFKVRKKKRRWASVGQVTPAPDGTFSACAKVKVGRRAKVARVEAVDPSGATGAITLRVSKKGSRTCPGDGSGSSTTGGGGGTTTTPPPDPDPSGVSVLREDPATNPDPIPLWNAIDAEADSRHQQFGSGGPSGGAFRRMTVQDGDDAWGERAELGYNSRLNGLGAPWGTFFLYGEGERRVTEFSMRLPSDFPISTSSWQVVMQMKQTGPATNSGGTPVLALEAREGKWVLTQSTSAGASSNTQVLWSTPATRGVWTPISLDVTYSPDPTKGKVQITVGGVQSPTITTYTQKYELSPAQQGLTVGGAIPSHLRLGIYHATSLPGTHVDFADVKVLG